MTTEEIKQTIDKLTTEERLFAAAYLKAQELIHDESWVTEIRNRKLATSNGNTLSSESIKDLHKSLKDRGL